MIKKFVSGPFGHNIEKVICFTVSCLDVIRPNLVQSIKKVKGGQRRVLFSQLQKYYNLIALKHDDVIIQYGSL